LEHIHSSELILTVFVHLCTVRTT